MLEDLDLSIIVYGVDHTSAAALSRLLSLRTLNIRLAVRGPSDIPLLKFSDFANLHHLSLYLHCFSTFSEILATRSLRTSQLRSVSLECSVRVPYSKQLQPLPIADFQHQLGIIRAALPDSLEALQLWLTYSTRAEPPLPLATLFAPFLTLNRLKSFDLSFRWGYVPHVLDEDLRIFAAAWPSLEVLSIFVREMGSPIFSSACPPTIVGLVELAKGCPRLRRVTLPAADVSVLPAMSALPSDGHKGVRFLDLSALVEDEDVVVEDVAKILDTVFPCLQEYSRVGEGMPHAESWYEVQGTMRKMQAARNGVGSE
uniref:Ketoreductase CTB6 ) n=1 Tax=Ganoderma boninense TaxID=34458 RepID=A0A5K1JTS8_9APHY|nr:Ketoreductase CTB6 (EC (Cercosporin toxin biosynthesis cluster protein 6) [Ganoderma boninense]